jgi:hypothetical protein
MDIPYFIDIVCIRTTLYVLAGRSILYPAFYYSQGMFSRLRMYLYSFQSLIQKSLRGLQYSIVQRNSKISATTSRFFRQLHRMKAQQDQYGPILIESYRDISLLRFLCVHLLPISRILLIITTKHCTHFRLVGNFAKRTISLFFVCIPQLFIFSHIEIGFAF